MERANAQSRTDLVLPPAPSHRVGIIKAPSATAQGNGTNAPARCAITKLGSQRELGRYIARARDRECDGVNRCDAHVHNGQVDGEAHQ